MPGTVRNGDSEKLPAAFASGGASRWADPPLAVTRVQALTGVANVRDAIPFAR